MVEGENNIFRNTQKIDILSNIAMTTNDDQYSTWESVGFELFDWIVLSFLVIALIYWGLRKVFRKEGLLDTMRKRKEEAKSKRLQKMREVLTKQSVDSIRCCDRHGGKST